jgi:hypothetical protein
METEGGKGSIREEARVVRTYSSSTAIGIFYFKVCQKLLELRRP